MNFTIYSIFLGALITKGKTDGTDDTLGRRNIYTNEWSKDLEERDHFETYSSMKDDIKMSLKKDGFLKCEMDLSGSNHDRVA